MYINRVKLSYRIEDTFLQRYKVLYDNNIAPGIYWISVCERYMISQD